MSGTVIVRKPGALSLVQDAGRKGFQRYGVSVSGAMDPDALLIGNLLVGNEPGAAAIEVTFGGAQFLFSEDALVAVTGGDLVPSLDGTPLPMWEAFLAPAGSTLQLASPKHGLRSYLAVGGGIATTPALGSRSTHVASGLGGVSGGPLSAGDELKIGSISEPVKPGASLPVELRTVTTNELTVRVISGPQQDAFSQIGIETFFSSVYTVTETSNRQGLRLAGPEIEAPDGRYDIVSDAVVFGAIQVPADGRPIILMADRQTTGGYAKIGVVATVDLPLLAQAPPRCEIRFIEISVTEAQQLMRDRLNLILSADLRSGLEAGQVTLSFGGKSDDVSIAYRESELSRPGGGLVTASINDRVSTVRVEEISQSRL